MSAEGQSPEEVLASPTPPATIAAEFLDEFERNGLPVFEARGYGRDAALTAWLFMHSRGDVVDVGRRVGEVAGLLQALGDMLYDEFLEGE